MNDTDKIIEALKPVADKLGKGAEHLYRVYVDQAHIVGVTKLSWAVLTFLIALAGLCFAWFCKKQAKHHTSKSGDGWDSHENASVNWYITMGFVLLGVIVSVFITGLLTSSGVKHLVNPEYYAIQDILCQTLGKGCGL